MADDEIRIVYDDGRTHEQFKNDMLVMKQQQQPPSPPIVTSQPRPPGKKPTTLLNLVYRSQTYHQGRPHPEPGLIDDALRVLRTEGIIIWTSNYRFTYAAVYAAGRWFITGKGGWYGKNEFTHEEFCLDVLCHSEVTSIAFGGDFDMLFEKSR